MSELLQILFFLSKLYYVLSYGNKPHENDFYTKCVNSIYRECNHRHEFREQEIENARIYIQNRYNNVPNPAYRPVRPPCQKLRVRKDFKCLIHNEKLELIDALQVMYRNGDITRLALWPHAVYWGQTHKFADFYTNHRWQMHELEMALQRVNPRLTLPYWIGFDDYDRPEQSILWDYLGRAGDKQSNYCVKDGPFANVKPCVKRHWVNDTMVRSWSPMEFYDANLQNIKTISDFFPWNNNAHFKVHFGIGGDEGHISNPNAPYDNSFNLFHVWNADVFFFKWQLQDDKNLMPESYDGINIYDLTTDRIRPGNLTKDRVFYFNVSTMESLQNTFGELCSIPDVIVEDITYITQNRQKEMPLMYRRMPKELLRKYFPKFYSGNYSPFDFLSYNVPQCNSQCLPVRQCQDFTETAAGQKFLHRMKWWALLDLSDQILDNEKYSWRFIDDANSYGYCSPYIIS